MTKTRVSPKFGIHNFELRKRYIISIHIKQHPSANDITTIYLLKNLLNCKFTQKLRKISIGFFLVNTDGLMN